MICKSKYPELYDKELMYKLYITENKTSVDIAKLYNCQPSQVRKRLHAFNIIVRKKGLCSRGRKRKEYRKYKPNPKFYNSKQKLCPKCKLWLDHIEFKPRLRTSSGLHSYCNVCDSARKHNIDRRIWLEILKRQNNKCAMPGCDKIPDAIDHNHKCCPLSKKSCGKCIRGLLCTRHNFSLGLFGDDVDQLKLAIEYLESHEVTL